MRLTVLLVYGIACVTAPVTPPARAQGLNLAALNPLSWFDTDSIRPRANSLPYSISVTGTETAPELLSAARDASLLQQLLKEAPVDGEELAQRIQADLTRITDAIWSEGYYAGEITIRIGQPGTTGPKAQSRIRAVDARGLASTAERYRNIAIVPVIIEVMPGIRYALNSITAKEARTGLPVIAPRVPHRFISSAQASLARTNSVTEPELGVSGGDPATTSLIAAATARLSDRYRQAGRPFVKVTRAPPVIDHRSQRVDIQLVVDPGPFAALGPVTIRGATTVDPAVIRSFIYTEPGDPYSPQALNSIRKSVSRIEALSAVRVTEGDRLDADGNLPLTVTVSERLPRLIGASAQYSTVDGPAIRTYWAHRNLFGGAERLRIDADLFYSRLLRDGKKQDFRLEDIGGRFSVSFLKPAIGGSRVDFLADAVAERTRAEGYDADLARATVTLRRRFSETFQMQVGVEAEAGKIRQAPGRYDMTAPRYRTHHGLIGLPVSLIYDSTDKPLDPTQGIKFTGSIAPYAGYIDAPSFMGIGRAQVSGYFALDPAARIVLAARFGAGTIVGGRYEDIPATRLLLGGGGGSVRGYAFRSLGPVDAYSRVLGGRSLIEGSFEARIKITDTIGFVPFIDAGQAYNDATPSISQKLRIGVGAGLRYYTSLGPVRVDLAVPVQREKREAPYAIYVSIGQAF